MTLFFSLFHARLRALTTLPAPALVGIGLFFLAGLAESVLMPFFALWARAEAGIPTASIGLLLGCYAGGELLATPLLGGIADRLERRPVLLISTLGVGGGFLLLHQVQGVWATAAALIVIGGFESVLHPTAATVIADLAAARGVTGGALREQFALVRVASSLGHAVGPMVGAVLAGWSLGLVFAGSAAAMLAGAVLVAVALPETRVAGVTPTADDGEDDEELGALVRVFRDGRLAGLLLPVAGLGVAASWIEAVLPLHAVDAGLLTVSGIGLLFTWLGVLGVVFQLPVTALSARLPGAAVAALAGGLLALGFAVLLLPASLPGLILAATLVGFAEMLSGPMAQGIVAELAPAGARASYMAALSAVQDLRDAAGPAIGTALYAAAAALPWMAGVPLALVASLALAAVARRHEAAAE